MIHLELRLLANTFLLGDLSSLWTDGATPSVHRSGATSKKMPQLPEEVPSYSATPTLPSPIPIQPIPFTHTPRLWWNHDRLQAARDWLAGHPFDPPTNDAWGNAFLYATTGDPARGNSAINSLLGFGISQQE